MQTIILASQSPRRSDLLQRMGVQFTVIPSDFDEQLDDARDPVEVAKELALGKANTVAAEHPEAIVIGSDCIVSINGQQLGKPADLQEARETLRRLSGQTNIVTTSVAVVCKADNLSLVEAASARVTFKPLDEQALEAYIQTGDPLDKAGSYGLQSGAAPLVERFEGDYDVIIGLPTRLLADMLQGLGVTAHHVEIPSPLA
jgi:septum formation protein